MNNKEKFWTCFLCALAIVQIFILINQDRELRKAQEEYNQGQEEKLELLLSRVPNEEEDTITINWEEYDEWEWPDTMQAKPVKITKYHPVKEQCDDTPLITADNSKIDLHKLKHNKLKWVAVSRDLLKDFKYGTKIKISTGDKDIDGIYEVHDTMNERWTNRIDILIHPEHTTGKGLWKGNAESIDVA